MKSLKACGRRKSSTALTLLLGGGLAIASAATATAEGLSEADAKVALANFEAADADQNGSLSSDEFKTFIDANAQANLGRASKIKRFGAYDKAFSTLDGDKDEAVTWDEFQNASS